MERIEFKQQQWLRERATELHGTCIVCLVNQISKFFILGGGVSSALEVIREPMTAEKGRRALRGKGGSVS